MTTLLIDQSCMNVAAVDELHHDLNARGFCFQKFRAPSVGEWVLRADYSYEDRKGALMQATGDLMDIGLSYSVEFSS